MRFLLWPASTGRNELFGHTLAKPYFRAKPLETRTVNARLAGGGRHSPESAVSVGQLLTPLFFEQLSSSSNDSSR